MRLVTQARAAAAAASPEILPAFTRPEQALLEKVEENRRNLDALLDNIAQQKSIEISTEQRNKIRVIFTDLQLKLVKLANKHVRNTQLPDFYRTINQFTHESTEAVAMLHLFLIDRLTMLKTHLNDEPSEEELFLEKPIQEKTLKELFEEFRQTFNNAEKIEVPKELSGKYNALTVTAYLSGRSQARRLVEAMRPLMGDDVELEDMLGPRSSITEDAPENLIRRKIERMDKLSTRLNTAESMLLNKRFEADFWQRFFDARREAALAIEKIHRVIHHLDDKATISEDDRCQEFEMLSLCHEIKNQMYHCLKKNKRARDRLTTVGKMMSVLGGKRPEARSEDDDSSDTSSCELSRSSSLSSDSESSANSSTSSGSSFSALSRGSSLFSSSSSRKSSRTSLSSSHSSNASRQQNSTTARAPRRRQREDDIDFHSGSLEKTNLAGCSSMFSRPGNDAAATSNNRSSPPEQRRS